jgi:hypothetical protein
MIGIDGSNPNQIDEEDEYGGLLPSGAGRNSIIQNNNNFSNYNQNLGFL